MKAKNTKQMQLYVRNFLIRKFGSLTEGGNAIGMEKSALSHALSDDAVSVPKPLCELCGFSREKKPATYKYYKKD